MKQKWKRKDRKSEDKNRDAQIKQANSPNDISTTSAYVINESWQSNSKQIKQDKQTRRQWNKQAANRTSKQQTTMVTFEFIHSRTGNTPQTEQSNNTLEVYVLEQMQNKSHLYKPMPIPLCKSSRQPEVPDLSKPDPIISLHPTTSIRSHLGRISCRSTRLTSAPSHLTLTRQIWRGRQPVTS